MEFQNIRDHLITCSPRADQTAYERAEGCRFFDGAGNSILNLNEISCSLGYSHPVFTRELSRLVTTKMLGHAGTFSREKEQLIANFMEVTHGDFDKIFFAACGGEVVGMAAKLAADAMAKGIALGRGGKDGNRLVVRAPLVLTAEEADFVCAVLAQLLA